MTHLPRGAATNDIKLWLSCGFAALGVGAVAWQALPLLKGNGKTTKTRLVTAAPTDEAGNPVQTNYRPARTTTQRQAVLADFTAGVESLATTLPPTQINGPTEGLAASTAAVVSTLMNVSEESIAQMFQAMGANRTNENGEPQNDSTLVRFMKGMFAEGELDLSRMVVRPKPDDRPHDGLNQPRKVSRDTETREQAAAAAGPGENRRVSAIRIVDSYDGMAEIAQKQRPVEVRVPYRPRGTEGERTLALDMLYNPKSRTWQMIEMRFEEEAMEDDG